MTPAQAAPPLRISPALLTSNAALEIEFLGCVALATGLADRVVELQGVIAGPGE